MKPPHPHTSTSRSIPSGLSCFFLALLLAACASSATHTTTSGVEGQVLIGPMCPVMQAGVPCPDQPYQATITVLDENRKKMTDFQSDAQGNFKIGLKPGTYILVPESPNHMTRAGEQTATVIEGQFIRVTINYDSGIR
ncbi:MAG: hypothetical protein A2W37_17130 [Chloroflexi bacterium RBG_16_63_12]|nr:MAG: hypothetical protein A2W37_17130 [Chloroflexi bacterium RBG_16_63_12]